MECHNHNLYTQASGYITPPPIYLAPWPPLWNCKSPRIVTRRLQYLDTIPMTKERDGRTAVSVGAVGCSCSTILEFCSTRTAVIWQRSIHSRFSIASVHRFLVTSLGICKITIKLSLGRGSLLTKDTSAGLTFKADEIWLFKSSWAFIEKSLGFPRSSRYTNFFPWAVNV